MFTEFRVSFRLRSLRGRNVGSGTLQFVKTLWAKQAAQDEQRSPYFFVAVGQEGQSAEAAHLFGDLLYFGGDCRSELLADSRTFFFCCGIDEATCGFASPHFYSDAPVTKSVMDIADEREGFGTVRLVVAVMPLHRLTTAVSGVQQRAVLRVCRRELLGFVDKQGWLFRVDGVVEGRRGNVGDHPRVGGNKEQKLQQSGFPAALRCRGYD
ncbi:MAG: hypothetical protein WA651_09010 [Candidatus Sulfotelmatobacter sp.]